MTHEYRTPVTQTYIVHLMCDCGGEIWPTGMALPVHPMRYVHRCQVCGVESNHTRTYPYIDYDYGNESESRP